MKKYVYTQMFYVENEDDANEIASQIDEAVNDIEPDFSCNLVSYSECSEIAESPESDDYDNSIPIGCDPDEDDE